MALLDVTHPTVPAAYRKPVQGVLLKVEVDDVDAEHRRLVGEAGLTEELPLRSEESGSGFFIVAAPDGVLIDVITNIPPAAGYIEQFAPGIAEQPSS